MTTTIQLKTTAEDHRIAWFSALAILIHVIESALPSPLPGVKPGLANVITIIVLCKYGWRTAAWVSVLRVLAGSLILGTFLSPTFMLSLTGALCSVVILIIASQLPGRGAGPIGFSVLAAMAHISGQFLMAWAMFIPHPGLWKLFPVLLTFAIILGIINGIISLMVLKRLQ
ncbi:MAG: Gx transporter family protein [Gammaproteobacteria bacterium]|nr:Gx transporter family protein [Gammaproteobacteria bacterium]MDH5776669.1 Gx transporter family protein [Gammaproteobacteria bacterium]